MMNPATRRLRLNLRRRCHATRRLAVHYMGGTTERFTCLTCHRTHTLTHGGSEGWYRRFAAYRAQRPITGECPHCTRDERARRYPLD